VKRTSKNWPKLCRYAEAENGMIEIDKILVETAIRPSTIGKKSWPLLGNRNGPAHGDQLHDSGGLPSAQDRSAGPSHRLDAEVGGLGAGRTCQRSAGPAVEACEGSRVRSKCRVRRLLPIGFCEAWRNRKKMLQCKISSRHRVRIEIPSTYRPKFCGTPPKGTSLTKPLIMMEIPRFLNARVVCAIAIVVLAGILAFQGPNCLVTDSTHEAEASEDSDAVVLTYVGGNSASTQTPSLATRRGRSNPTRQRVVSLSYSPSELQAALSSSNEDEFALLRTWIDELPDSPTKIKYQIKLFEEWMKREFKDAKAAAFVMRGDAGVQIRERLFQLASFADRQSLFGAMNQPEKLMLIEKHSKVVAKSNPGEAIMSIGAIEDPIEREQILERFLRVMIFGGDYESDSLSDPSKRYESGDVVRAWEVAQEVGDAKLRDMSAYLIGYTTSSLDSERAGNLLNSIPEGRFYDLATLGYVSEVARFEAGSAMPWVKSIQDSKIRSTAFEIVSSSDQSR